MSMQGYVMQLQPMSVNDGEGIRTIIFIAGCPMRCKWCSNPESRRAENVCGWYERRCIGCGECARVCPQGIGIDLNAQRELCIACGKCAAVCPKGARSMLVSLRDADEIIEEVEKHAVFFRNSGGGITFSGGEATSQPELLEYMSAKLWNKGYSLDLETCGLFDFDAVKPALERMDLIFMDLKLMDDEKHRLFTGVSNRTVLENIKRLNEVPAQVVIRIPTIEGVNADEDNIRASAAYVHANLPKARMELLPYHKFGSMKYEALGLPVPGDEFARPSDEKLEMLRDIIRSEGVELADFR